MQSIDSITKLALMISVVVVFGGFGGVSGILYRTKTDKNHKSERLTLKDLLLWAICGIWSAGAVVILGTAAATFFDRQNLYLQWFILIFLSGIAGFFAHRWLPNIASKFERDLKLMQTRMMELETGNAREISSIRKKSDDAIGYNQALNMAYEALSSRTSLELEEASGIIEPILKQYPDDRMLHITYARLLRWSGRVTEAILCLRRYVSRLFANADRDHRSLNDHEKMAIGVAQYNIACYHAILMKERPQEENRLIVETREAFLEAVKYVPTFATAFTADEDFSALLLKYPTFPKEGVVRSTQV